MFLKKLDMISPPITIFFKGHSSHPTIISGILTLAVCFISCYFGIRYTIEFIRHQNPQIYYYNRYVEDAGEFPVNSSQIFSFIQVLDTDKNTPEEVDFNSIRIIGLETEISLYKNNNNLSEYNHWIYGKCNNSTDTKNIENLIDFSHFTESACIRKYYNKNNKRYYNTDDENFIWPKIIHGCSHPDRTFYGIVLEKCRNDSLKILSDGNYCKSPEQIIDYIKKSSVALQLIDNYADVLNYEHPFTKYFYTISNGLFEESFTTNHLNFNPATLITNDAIFFENDKKSLSYIYQQNEKVTGSSDNSGIYVAFYFWMQNRMYYYERKYRNFQDALSDIGGLISLFLNFSYILNYLICNFAILYDTEGLLNEIESSKKFSKNIIKNNVYKNLIQLKNLFRSNENTVNKNNYKLNNKASPIRKSHPQITFNELSNNGNSSNKSFLFFDKKKNKRNKNIIIPKINSNVSKNNNLKINSTEDFNQINIFRLDEKREKNIDKKRGFRRSVNFRYVVDISSIEKRKSINSKIRIKFHEYAFYFFSCGKFHQNLNCLEEFRCRIISEENLILNYLNVCKLLKATKNIIKDIEDDKNNNI